MILARKNYYNNDRGFSRKFISIKHFVNSKLSRRKILLVDEIRDVRDKV